MPRIVYHPIVSEMHNKLGKMVFCEKKGVSYIRRWVAPTNPNTPKQQAVRSAFKTLVTLWKQLDVSDIFHNSWKAATEGTPMSGYNAFIKANAYKEHDGDPLVLFKVTERGHALDFKAQTGTTAGSITCTFSPAPLTNGETLTVFTQEVIGADDLGSDQITIHRQAINTTSPVTISGLTTGSKYFVYAVVTDKAYDTATLVLASSSVRGTMAK
jgi:hypothetical protein